MELDEVDKLLVTAVTPQMYRETNDVITNGSEQWQNLNVSKTQLYPWNPNSTYIHQPPFFKEVTQQLETIRDLDSAYVLCNFGDSVTTDHISPAGKISLNSPA